MERTLSTGSCVVISFFFLCALSGPAQTLPSKKAATNLLQKAVDDSDLRSADTPPYHLVAKFHYELGRSKYEGMYEYLRASPDKFRENFKMENDAEVDVVTQGQRYIWRNTPTPRLPLFTLRMILEFSLKRVLMAQPQTRSVLASSHGDNPLTCIEADDLDSERRACFDPTTSLIISAERRPKKPEILDDERADDFASLGTKRFPRHIVLHRFDEMMEVQIQSLELVTRFADDVFSAPRSAEAHDWCPDPSKSSPRVLSPGATLMVSPSSARVDSNAAIWSSPGGAPSMRMAAPGELMAYYLLVGKDGTVKTAVALRQNDPYTPKQLSKMFQMMQFPVLRCKDQRIEHEELYIAPVEIIAK